MTAQKPSSVRGCHGGYEALRNPESGELYDPRCGKCVAGIDPAHVYPHQNPQPERCRSCGLSIEATGSGRLFPTGDGRTVLCWRCFDREAPRGHAVCRTCSYEKPVGLPCGEPCV